MADPRNDAVKTLSEVVVTASRLSKTELVPNPLHKYASYTYNISLWWLDTSDFTKLMSSTDVDTAMAWSPSANGRSYCVAADAGLYSDYRVPGRGSLNYNIQDFKIETTITPNKTSRSSNLLEGSLTLIEPIGVTWFETLLAASYDGSTYGNWTRQPFMVQIDFVGYDDAGSPIPLADTLKYRKRFPISILTAKLNITNKGAEYKLTFCPMGATAHYPDYATTPKVFTVTADTVGKFFEGISSLYTQYYLDLIVKGQATYAERIDFDIATQIAKSKIVSDKALPIPRANSKANNIDLKQSTFTIPAGTPILDIITKVMAHSDFLINDQLKLENGGAKSDYDIFQAFKTTSKVINAGYDLGSGQVLPGVIDRVTNKPPKNITYSIAPYAIFDGNHQSLPKLTDSAPYTVKKYDYYYTGQNTDVINFKLDFDTTYYTAIQAYTSAIAATESSQSTLANEDAIAPPRILAPVYNPVVVAGQIPTLTPLMFKSIVKDKESSSGMNMSSRPAAQVAADVIKAIYTNLNGDMLSLDMDIVGDPTLIKQDDWLYIVSPTISKLYYGISQAKFAEKYGHIKTDDSQVVVTVNVNSPIDMDTDYTNQGLMTPLVSYQKSIFSGQYKILTIVSKFANGKFEQSLKLARFINNEIIEALRPTGSAVATSQQNQNSTNPRN